MLWIITFYHYQSISDHLTLSINSFLGYDGMMERGIAGGDMKIIRALKPEEEELINRYIHMFY